MSRLMTRGVAAIILALGTSVAYAQPGPTSIDVIAKSTDAEFQDVYQFQEDGTLLIGGFTSLVTVRQLVPETFTEQVPYTVLVFENGRFVVETRYRQRTRTVYKPVFVTSEVPLPPVRGFWIPTGLNGVSLWFINSIGPSGTVIGFGTRNGDAVSGSVNYLNFNSAPPSGFYEISTAPDNPCQT